MIDKHTGAITNGGIFSLYKQAPCWRIKSVGDCWRVTGLGEPSPQVKSAAEAKIRRAHSQVVPQQCGSIRPFGGCKAALFFFFLFSNQDGCYFTSLANVWSRDQTCVKRGDFVFLSIIWYHLIDVSSSFGKPTLLLLLLLSVCVWLVCWWFSNVNNYFSFSYNRCRLHRKPISWSTLFYLHHPRIPAGKNNYFFPPSFLFCFSIYTH